VLIAPEDDPGGFDGRSRSTVVAGIGEHLSDAAVIQAAWAESFRHRCDLELVHAYHELPAETPDQGLRRAADVTARTIAEAQVPLDARASVLLTRDTPAGALSRQAEGCLLLVIGSRPGSLSGLVLGSVGREILNSLSCPMLVIPDGVIDLGSQRPAGSTSGTIDLTSRAGSPLRIT
jgi:nucleotide-binding universal stress UspA family protein